ncbi:MAG: hypothetical protein Q7S96_01525 [bacterium]|nr:hypothetical protein [bacterium]
MISLALKHWSLRRPVVAWGLTALTLAVVALALRPGPFSVPILVLATASVAMAVIHVMDMRSCPQDFISHADYENLRKRLAAEDPFYRRIILALDTAKAWSVLVERYDAWRLAVQSGLTPCNAALDERNRSILTRGAQQLGRTFDQLEAVRMLIANANHSINEESLAHFLEHLNAGEEDLSALAAIHLEEPLALLEREHETEKALEQLNHELRTLAETA